MSEVIGMSLDEIITAKKKNRQSSRGRVKKPQQPRKADNIAVKSVTQKLVVSNLAPSVTQNDVKELFSKIGPVKSAQLNFNEQGKSKGVATVLYQNPGDAAKAYQEYNTRTFDNKPMRIELIVNPESSGFQKLAQVPRQQQGGVNKTRGGRGARRGGRGGRTRSPKVALTSEQLDAEMDSYMNDENMGDATELANALA